MYRVLGDVVVDVDELISTFNGNGIYVYENVTRATKRDDAVGLRLYFPINDIIDKKSINLETSIDKLMELAEKVYGEKIYNIINENFRFIIYAYKYDEVKESILLNFVMMDSFMQKKLKDVIKRLFDI